MMCLETDVVLMWVAGLTFLWVLSTVVLSLFLLRAWRRVKGFEERFLDTTYAYNDMIMELNSKVEALATKPKRKTARKKPAAKPPVKAATAVFERTPMPAVTQPAQVTNWGSSKVAPPEFDALDTLGDDSDRN